MIDGAEETGEKFHGNDLVTFKIKLPDGALPELKEIHDSFVENIAPGQPVPAFDLWLGFLTCCGSTKKLRIDKETFIRGLE